MFMCVYVCVIFKKPSAVVTSWILLHMYFYLMFICSYTNLN